VRGIDFPLSTLLPYIDKTVECGASMPYGHIYSCAIDLLCFEFEAAHFMCETFPYLNGVTIFMLGYKTIIFLLMLQVL
jgi:hypothetical protein